MRVAVYHRSVPNKKNQEKIQLLQFFSQTGPVNVLNLALTQTAGVAA